LGAAMGTGCHLERGPALYRALAEAAQMRLLQITAARDDLVPADYAPPDAARQERLRAGVAGRGTAGFRTLPAHVTSELATGSRPAASSRPSSSISPIPPSASPSSGRSSRAWRRRPGRPANVPPAAWLPPDERAADRLSGAVPAAAGRGGAPAGQLPPAGGGR